MVQPQPHRDSTFQWDMAEEEAVVPGNSLTTELAGPEVVSRLLLDNNQLRGMVSHFIQNADCCVCM